jgi:hypothetical protein
MHCCSTAAARRFSNDAFCPSSAGPDFRGRCHNAAYAAVSGRLGHSNPADRSRDAQRRNELQDLGYAVYEYTWGDVTRRSGYVIDTLRERLSRRSRTR